MLIKISAGPDATPTRHHPWAPLSGWIAFIIALVVVRLVQRAGAVADVAYLAAAAGAGVAAFVFLAGHDHTARRGLVLLAASVAASGFADLVWEVIAAVDNEPDVSVADVFYLASYVLLISAVLGRSTHTRWWRTPDVDGLIDLVTFTTVALVVIDHLVDLGATLDDTSVSPGVRLVWVSYPVLDAVLLAAILSALTTGRLRGRTGAFLLTGAACWLLADIGYLREEGALTAWLDAGWMLGAGALAAAVAVPSGTEDVLDRPERSVGAARILVNLVPLLIPPGLHVLAHAEGLEENVLSLSLAMVVLVVCAYLRNTRLMRARDAQERRIVEREHYHRVLANNSFDAVVVIDRSGCTRTASVQLAEMFGRDDLGAPGADVIEALPADQRERLRSELERLWATPGARAESDLEIPDHEGRPRWFHLRTVNLRHDPTIGGVVLNLYEVTERKLAERELAHQAFHDALTGLPNRALFNERVSHTLQSARGRGTAVIFLDVDGFKSANDRFGHGVGDQLLQQVAARLAAVLRDSDTVARFGGDEFAILIECAHDPLDEATTAAERVLQELSQPFRLGDHELTLSASIGVAIASHDATAETLLRDADIAMYRSKAAGKARWTVYEADMRAAAIEQSELRADLEHVIERGELRLVYQPVVRLETETIVGFEALLRWHHPIRGQIPPDVFVPIAEASGSIIKIGEWVLDEACRTAARWQRVFPEVRPTMSVNLSARQISDPALVRRVSAALERAGLDARKLVLEMTESALVEDPDVAAARLMQLRDLGVRLAIDDFGTGYSSLSYLRQFPIDIIKIDRSFINAITDRAQVPAIVRGLLDLGRTLELATVAEGIEGRDQLASLRDEQCDYGQGYLFAHPLSRELAEDLVSRLALDAASI